MTRWLLVYIAVIGLFFAAPLGIAGVAYADTTTDLKQACVDAEINGTSAPAYCANITETENPISGTNGIINRITNVIALVGGIVAVIMVIYGGFRYIISNGDPAKLTAARQTITYALIGLVILLLARTIILFVLGNIA